MNKNTTFNELRIDITNICNLSCPLCPNTNRRNKKVEHNHFMSIENFKLLVDNIDYNIERFSIGTKHEPMLNKDIFLMANYLKTKHPRIEINLLSNLNFNYSAKEIVESGITNIIVGLDGINQETYAKYRVGGNFNNVINKIKEIQKYKTDNNLEFPVITISFIVFRHNEYLVQQARQMAKNLDINIFFRRTDCHNGYEDWLPENFHDEELNNIEERNDILVCNEPFNYLNINTFGDVLPCCAEEALNYTVGNIFKNKLSEICNGIKLKNIKEFLSLKYTDKDIPCTFCPIYKNNGYTNYVKFKN